MKPFLQRSLADAEVVPLVRAMSVVLVLVVGATFFVSAVMIRSTLSDTVGWQAAVRKARVSRGRVLTAQLDEESGLRGFAATGEPIFLQPFGEALRAWPRRLAELHDRLEVIDPSIADLTVTEGRLNDIWLRTVAQPMLRHPALRHSFLLHVRGKLIIDDFRAVDAVIYDDQEKIAAASDGSSARYVNRVVIWSSIVGLAATLLVLAFSFFLIRTLEEMRANRRAYEEEKRIADLLQEAFIQKALPHIAAVALDAVYVPAGMETQVGGDWYDAFELPDKRILFSIGDVCGHGIQAAIVMSRARQAILSAGMSATDPGTVLALANEVLLLQDSTMVTAICGYIEPWSMKIAYATAGHPPPILALPDGSARALPASGPPLGATHGIAYTTFIEQGAFDAMLVLYTDGLIEYERDIVRGEERLLEAVKDVARTRPEHPAQNVFDSIFKAAGPPDDVALLVATFAEGPPERTLPDDSTVALARAARELRSGGGPRAAVFNILVPELRRVSLLKSSSHPSMHVSLER
jgi:CHASE3 domain sensor protein